MSENTMDWLLTNLDQEFPPKRVDYFEGKAREILTSHSCEFNEVVKGKEKLVQEGDKQICLGEGTGYNIVLVDDDMPLSSDKDLIFYNNYIGRPHHFGLLLANMEVQGIITPDIVSFGKKATKVLYDGSWELEPEDEHEEEISFTDENGVTFSKRVNRTVETVVIFSPHSQRDAAKIASYLIRRTDQEAEGYIEGSWSVPDIRATVSLSPVLVRGGDIQAFRLVIANVFEENQSKLIVLRQESKFGGEWKSDNTVQNEKLARYLASQDFKVLP